MRVLGRLRNASELALAPSWRRRAGRRGRAAAAYTVVRPRTCMRVASNRKAQRGSPVEHLSSFNPSYRNQGFLDAWHRASVASTGGTEGGGVCFTRIDLDGPATAARLFGHIDARRRDGMPWFATTTIGGEYARTLGSIAPDALPPLHAASHTRSSPGVHPQICAMVNGAGPP